MKVDYSVYLVTDSTMIPSKSTFLNQVQQAINGGATLVQLREKSLSTLEFIQRAKAVHKLTQEAQIPLIINDRIDVALAIDAEGVHVGQDDMPAVLARKILGSDKIIGVTCSNPEEVLAVCRQNVADYVGIGTVYKTATKTDTKTPMGTGPIGIRKMLQVLKLQNSELKCVAIGGINQDNVAKVVYQCCIEGRKLDGVAIVSCIMAAEDSKKATEHLIEQMKSPVPWMEQKSSTDYDKKSIESQIQKLKHSHPLVHHITNNVVKNFSANVTLAIGASPIMSELAEEFEEFASKTHYLSLVLNLGTPSMEMMKVFLHAVQIYNKYGKHIVFDPVAAGATDSRLQCCKTLLNSGQMSVIKGNLGEISAIWKLTSNYNSEQTQPSMRGVDSIISSTEHDTIKIGKQVSEDFKCVVVITGPVNYIIEGPRVCRIKGGNPIMGKITGSGCSLGSVIAAFIGANADSSEYKDFTVTYGVDIFEAVCGAVGLYNSSGIDTHTIGPGAFVPRFIDRLSSYTSDGRSFNWSDLI